MAMPVNAVKTNVNELATGTLRDRSNLGISTLSRVYGDNGIHLNGVPISEINSSIYQASRDACKQHEEVNKT
uniref:Uncharacterized protein n=1 Tax=Timema cristinae TaxID=61476 RepID=A0A7R9GVJ2_TIMCR|nr:unnamed protein product [Timema cristinae]